MNLLVLMLMLDRHKSVFVFWQYMGTVQENKVGEIVARLTVTDKDEASTANSMVKFTIIDGNEEGFFNVSTAPNKMEGIITTIKVKCPKSYNTHTTQFIFLRKLSLSD